MVELNLTPGRLFKTNLQVFHNFIHPYIHPYFRKLVEEMIQETPTDSNIPLKTEGFTTLAEALDYAATGASGLNFYDRKGALRSVLPYSDLRRQARKLARRLLGLGIERGSRIALVADTDPDFVRYFFACQYAGLVAVPLPAAVHLGGRSALIDKLRGLLEASGAKAAMAPREFLPFLQEAAAGLGISHLGPAEYFEQISPSNIPLRSLEAEETAYLQYTSGSTRFPRGVVVKQKAVMSNLAGITSHGLQVRAGDRAVSWLPFYHDMGLVGFLLAPLASQISVDYLATRDFAMRPRLWPALISRNHGTISYSPTFGYSLCARRLAENGPAEFDLSSWRIAGVGAEPIRADVLDEFASVMAPGGFKKEAFLASYGMAECSLAVSFAPLDKGIETDLIDGRRLAEGNDAVAVNSSSFPDGVKITSFVLCGRPLPGHEVTVRDSQGNDLPERKCGTIFVRGSSLMSEYLNNPEATREVLEADGWLNTGDLGYRVNGQLVITGREKDLIIINGRNIWPQDIEYLAEQMPEVRPRDTAAFSIAGPQGEEVAVIVVQCRQTDVDMRDEFVKGLQRAVREEFGIDCLIELVPPHTLPHTSSGKLSRSTARREFLERQQWTEELPEKLVENFR